MEKKYIPLADYFLTANLPEITLTYKEIETIMGQQLPNAAYLNSSWWKKTKAPFTHFEAWLNAGYEVKSIRIGTDVCFSKLTNDHNATIEDVLIVREINTNDARLLINLKQSIFSHSTFDHFSEDEFECSVQAMRKEIVQIKKEKQGTILICIFNGITAGYVSLTKQPSPRRNHVCTVHIGVLHTLRKKGIANALLNEGIKWAKNQNIDRLEATVVDHNEAAMATFISNGFHSEGLRIQSFEKDETKFNEVYLCKFISE